MIDKSLRDLERFQDSIRLKLLQRRLRMGVYVQEYPRPIQVFNSTELLINLPEDENSGDAGEHEHGDGEGSGYGNGEGYGSGWGYGDGEINGDGHGYGYGSGKGAVYTGRRREGGYGFGGAYGYENKEGYGEGRGYGKGYGSESGNSAYSYTENLRRNTQWIKN